jgi:hypothetical protein
MFSQLGLSVLSALWMFGVVRLHFSMTVKAQRNTVVVAIVSIRLRRRNMMQFHLGPTKAMADTAMPSAIKQSRFRYLVWETHFCTFVSGFFRHNTRLTGSGQLLPQCGTADG